MARPNRVRNDLLVCLLLILITLAVYWQAQHWDFVILDDPLYVTENPRVQAGLSRDSVIWAFSYSEIAYWHPMIWLSLMFDYGLYGLSPRGYHLTNIVLHALSALLLFLALKRMTGSLWQSAFVAFLFALHPLNVESVAWVTERKSVLSTFFWMLIMWTYARYVERPQIFRYLLVFLPFALGLMAKPTLVTLPFVLLLLDYWPLGRLRFGQVGDDPGGRITNSAITGLRRSSALGVVSEKIPLFALSVISISLTSLSVHHAGTVIPTESVPMKLRSANVLVSYLSYIGKMFWPRDLAVFYPYPSMVPLWQAAAAGLLLVCISVLLLLAWRRLPYLLIGWLWYLGTLIPASGLMQTGLWPAMADRFAYVPLIGLFIMISWGVPDLLAAYRHRLTVMTVAAGIALSALAIGTRTQLHHWRNSVALFEHTARITADNYFAHNNLGVAMFGQGNIEEAVLHYTEALQIKPDYAYAHHNLGLALQYQGRLEEARRHYHEALRIMPNYAKAHNNLGFALALQGKIEEAIAHYRQALQGNPDYAKAYYNLANALAEQGRVEEAMAQYHKALSLKPDFALAHYNLGNVLSGQGRIDEASTHLSKAIALAPNLAPAHNDLGDTLARQGKFDQAIVHFSKAIALEPSLTPAHSNLGKALAREGELDQAMVHFSTAIALDPNFAEAHHHLGNVLMKQGKLAEARSHYSKALDLRPDYAEAHNNLGVALFQSGNLEEALTHFSEAIRLKPDYVQAQNNKQRLLQAMGGR